MSDHRSPIGPKPGPTFSIIMPCYNCEATLARAVRSVLEQSWNDFELILVDDGSRDGTFTLAGVFARTDPRVRVLSQVNQGASAARNRGLAEAKGALIAFLDADDWWEPGKLAAHRASHEADPALDVTFAGIVFVPDVLRRKALTQSKVPAGRLCLAQILSENPVCTMSNVVARRAVFARHGAFREDMTHAEDQEWLTRLVAQGAQVRGIRARLVCYRTSEAGLSAQLDAMYAGWRSFAGRYAPAAQVRRSEALYCRYLARRALRLPGSALPALRFTLRGLALDLRAFLSDPRRGPATALCSLIAPILPLALRRRIFA
ncbi:glycosyltransferase [Novosphingobium sp. 1949]|uniref:Glycosyltransferase n=1 Tax=Novosphingobium organovorum TaxID=2930092 RepID=A0ABT0BHQ3_9SPHN|nr:glycosyltransferase family A protein [Novosphingobium organovorum]MCJ2184596.1 glycosyltransferase [Novosphingobium organovorum]